MAGSAILYFVFKETDYGLYVLFVGSFIFGLLQMFVGVVTKSGKTEGGMVVVFNDFYKMPKTMKQLRYGSVFFVVCSFCDVDLHNPRGYSSYIRRTDPTSELYNKGADWVGVLMAVYNGFAAVMAFVLIWLAERQAGKRFI